ncbi:hypothetical protein LX36DRAFT_487484 [Colletotrichum falcatum]|nr:hypothetical protein LX36DRAFT_487484 [Colletotrichum falcatum]
MHAVILSHLTSTGACWNPGRQPTTGPRVRSYPLPPDSREAPPPPPPVVRRKRHPTHTHTTYQHAHVQSSLSTLHCISNRRFQTWGSTAPVVSSVCTHTMRVS